MAPIADEHWQSDFFLYLGRHVGLPVALEGALKLKEISYIATDAYAAGEMKHGPIALLDELDARRVRGDRLAGARQGRLEHAGGPRAGRARDRDRHRGQRRDRRARPRRSITVPALDWMLAAAARGDPAADAGLPDRAAARPERRPAAQPREDRHRRVATAAGTVATRAATSIALVEQLPAWLTPLPDAEAMRATRPLGDRRAGRPEPRSDGARGRGRRAHRRADRRPTGR